MLAFALPLFYLAQVQAAPFIAALDNAASPPTSPTSISSLVKESPDPKPMVLVPNANSPTTTSPMRVTSTLEIGGGTTTMEETITSTITVTSPGQTVTVHAKPVTKTEIISVTPTPTPATPDDGTKPKPTRRTWTAPTRYTDLSCFNITKFAYGQDNIQLVNVANGPQNASAAEWDTPVLAKGDAGAPNTALQAFFPQGSINPGNNPQGGADFYATPLNIASSMNVSMEYEVFFPKNFNFVNGGKLPGLYGGRPGCSGGDAAEDCFSTRMMWRKNGMGELYLVRRLFPVPTGISDADDGG